MDPRPGVPGSAYPPDGGGAPTDPDRGDSGSLADGKPNGDSGRTHTFSDAYPYPDSFSDAGADIHPDAYPDTSTHGDSHSGAGNTDFNPHSFTDPHIHAPTLGSHLRVRGRSRIVYPHYVSEVPTR